MGLRVKSAFALCLSIGLVLALAVVAGGRALQAIEENLGSAFARNVTQYNKQRILAPVQRELALSQRFAGSEVTRRWLLDESNPAKKDLFFAEAKGYQQAFADHSYFVISATSLNYYFNDTHSPPTQRPHYALKRNDPHDAWFFKTMRQQPNYGINVDFDTKLKLTKVWFNIRVQDGPRRLGLAGTGLDLTQFLNRFITDGQAGTTPMVLDGAGDIQVYPDKNLIDYLSGNKTGAAHSTIYRLLNRAEDQSAMRAALARATAKPEQIQMFWAELNGQRQLFALSCIPELKWYVVTAVDLKAARVIDKQLWLPPLLSGIALLTLLLLAITIAINRILLTPLLNLTQSVRSMSAGQYEVVLPPASNDELGELTHAFGALAAQVRSYTTELETKVRERTRELSAVNEQMAGANKKIGDSIQYASLIQNAILPNHELERALEGQHFVLWRPRDVVGGDFYVFRAGARGCLLGVVDCAGHGVPGAFMTMIAHTIINVALDTLGLADPARVLTQMDTQIRAMLRSDPRYAAVATNMDAGLAYIDFETGVVTFAGAKVSLYWCDGNTVGEIKGDRYAIGDKKPPIFSNQQANLDPQATFYLTTDGFFDQAGGPKGYSFGQARFAELLRRHAGRPFAAQKRAFDEELAAYQGDLPQRDDITLLSFRFKQA